jgi:AcrR family transcriptional regulator
MTAGDEAGLGLRERKKRETRLALSRATIRLCVERGWDGVSVEDVAAAANVSVRTFRNYFSGKAEAIAASHFDRMVRIADELRVRPAEEPLWDCLFDAVLAEFVPGGKPADSAPSVQRWQQGLRSLLTEPALQGEVLKAYAAAQEELAKAVADRTGTDVVRDVYPTLVAAVAGAAITVAVDRALLAESPTPLAPVLRDAFDRISAGLPAH